MRKQFLRVVSTAIPLLLLVLILNFFSGLIPTDSIQGLPVILPIFLCPVGAVLGVISYRLYKDRWSLTGIVFNIVMFLFPVFYHVIGTVIFGV
ncbi:hypothetical protein SAMN04488054_12320 [Salibacterium qingdaonense]|uniref:Uncharacterized protein n=2 Tax=Salibacterium qingdaonense TaxID=266892 RepID=A0A1I4P5F3_9BACI|nr:hypothetical protein SAMN04488054_12320 [Salibacterium qingdaonense]